MDVTLCFHVIFKHLCWWNKTCHVISWLQQLVRSSTSSMNWVFWFSQNGWRQNLQIVFHMQVVPHLLEGSSHHWHEVLKHFNELFPYVKNHALICWLSHLSSKSILLTKKSSCFIFFFFSLVVSMPMKHIIHHSPFYDRLQRSRFMATNLCFWHSITNWMFECSKDVLKPKHIMWLTTIVVIPMFYFFFFPPFFLPLSPFLPPFFPPFLPLPCFIIRLNKEIPHIGEIYLMFLIITN